MRFARIACLLSLAMTLPASAAPQVPGRPGLIVAISVDQLSADLFAQYRPHFAGGFRRLQQGAVFPSGFQSHAATETCPGHSTILTGARPSRTGIIANSWYDLSAAREDKYVYCAEDERVPGSSSSSYTVSPFHLRVPTLGDRMRRADPRSRVVAVAGKDRAAVMMGGHASTERWWWGGSAFVGHAGAAAPAAVSAVNAEVAAAIAAPRDASPLPAVCAARDRAVPVEGGGGPVGTGRFSRAAGDRTAFRASPDFDAAVLAISSRLIADMRLGRGPAPDLVAIGLSATDYVGHLTGTQGAEMCAHLLALDALLGRFFEELDAAGIDYAAVLTADHGGLDIPERARREGGLAASRVDPALDARAMGERLGQRLGLPGRILFGDGSFGDMYVDRSLSEASRGQVLAAAVAAYRAHPQVAAVLTRAELAAAPLPQGDPDGWTLLERARASFDSERSGDLVVLLRPWVTPIHDTGRGYVATHGSPWDYDRRVPILFWRRGMTSFEQPLGVETADIMPTLAALIGLPVPASEIDGQCLDLDPGEASTCAQATPEDESERG